MKLQNLGYLNFSTTAPKCEEGKRGQLMRRERWRCKSTVVDQPTVVEYKIYQKFLMQTKQEAYLKSLL